MKKAGEPRLALIEAVVHGRILVRDGPKGRSSGLLLGFHGYAENAATQLARLAAIPGAIDWTIVSVQALNRFYRGRSDEVVAGWMTREDREHMIADNIRYIDAVVESLRTGAVPGGAHLSASPEAQTSSIPIVYAGFSQGVAMAFRAAVRGRAACAGIIAVGGDVPPELLEDAGCRFPRVLLARGERDEWYTAAKLESDLAALRVRGVDVRTLVFDGGHEWLPGVDAEAAEVLRTLVTWRNPPG